MANILTTEEITELRHRHGQEKDRRVCDRIKAVLLYDKGWSLQEIAEALLLSDESIRKHIRDYQQAKKLKPENGGSESKLDVQDANELKEHLAKNTYQYVKNICAYVKDKYGKKYTVGGMKLWLINNGFRYKKPHIVPAKANLEQQEQFVNQYNKLMRHLSEDKVVYFMDSVHPQHQAKASYGWIIRGERKTIATNSGQKRMHITGAICLDNMNVIYQENERINSDSVVGFLKKLEEANAKQDKIYLICDNAGYHKDKKVKEFLERSKIKLIFLPAYSPNLNPIERLWKVMHENVTYNKYYLKFTDFTEAIRNFFGSIPKLYDQLIDRITDNFSMIKFNPITNSST